MQNSEIIECHRKAPRSAKAVHLRSLLMRIETGRANPSPSGSAPAPSARSPCPGKIAYAADRDHRLAVRQHSCPNSGSAACAPRPTRTALLGKYPELNWMVALHDQKVGEHWAGICFRHWMCGQAPLPATLAAEQHKSRCPKARAAPTCRRAKTGRLKMPIGNDPHSTRTRPKYGVISDGDQKRGKGQRSDHLPA